jgi:hypothetical protein
MNNRLIRLFGFGGIAIGMAAGVFWIMTTDYFDKQTRKYQAEKSRIDDELTRKMEERKEQETLNLAKEQIPDFDPSFCCVPGRRHTVVIGNLEISGWDENYSDRTTFQDPNIKLRLIIRNHSNSTQTLAYDRAVAFINGKRMQAHLTGDTLQPGGVGNLTLEIYKPGISDIQYHSTPIWWILYLKSQENNHCKAILVDSICMDFFLYVEQPFDK